MAAPIILLGPAAAAAAAAVDPDTGRPAAAPVAETERGKVSVSASLKTVLGIRDFLVRIPTNGSGSNSGSDFFHQ